MDPVHYNTRARQALEEGELDLAEQYFNLVLQHFPHNEEAKTGLRDIEVVRAQHDSFIVKGYRYLRGHFLQKIGKYDKAFQDLELFYRGHPNHFHHTMAYAKCVASLGRLEEAHQAYQKALEQNATHANALEEDAKVLVKLERFEEAAQQIQRLQQLRPKDDRITHWLRDISAQAYSRAGIPEKLQERRAQIEKKKREAPGAPEFMERLETMLEAYKKEPENLELGVEIASHYRQGKLYNEANKILAPILDQNPEFIPAQREQARVWLESGEIEIANQLFEELHENDPEDMQLKDEYLRAHIAFLQKKKQEGDQSRDLANEVERIKIEHAKTRIQILQNVLREHPEADQERAELGNLLIQQGRVDEAIPTLQRLINNLSWAGRGYFLLGQAFRAKGDLKLAVHQYEQSLEYFKNRDYSHIPSKELKDVYYYLGKSLLELNEKERAREALGQIYSVDINFKDIRKLYEEEAF